MNRMNCFAAVVLVFAGASAALAQQPANRQVSATGTATITARPEILRVTVQLRSEGSGARQAMDKLTADIKSAREKFVAAGAAEDAVKVTDPALGTPPLNAQQQQMRMIAQMQRGGGAKPKSPTSQPTVLTATLTADVPVKSTDGPSLVLAASDLQDKLKSAFKHDTKAMTPEEQEVMEEMQQQSGEGAPAAQPNEPAFAYVHVLTDAERSKALADAFAAAKDSASRLAKAAGADVAELLQVSGSSATGAVDASNPYAEMIATFSAAGGGAGTAASAGSVGREATGAQAGPVTCTVTVRADFALK